MRLPSLDPVALGLTMGWLADRAFADPRRGHPVALFGRWASFVESRTYRDSTGAGLLTEALTLAPLIGLGVFAGSGYRAPRALTTAAATWICLGGTSLEREGIAVHDLLAAGDLPGARCRVRNLVGRVTDDLSEQEVARAALESVAENTSDAVVGTLLWGALLGPLGVLLHRGVNTLDAMHGHRTERYQRFGWAAARFDDVLGWPAARLTVAATAAASPLRAVDVIRVAITDARAHPSPNAGPVEGGFAAALSITLGGRTVYASGTEDRGALGSGPPPGTTDLLRAVTLARRVSAIALGIVVISRGLSATLREASHTSRCG